MYRLVRLAVPPVASAMAAWFAAALPRGRIVHWRGHFAADLWQPESHSAHGERGAPLADIAGYAWRLSGRGLARLAQRRRGEDEFDHLLEVRPRPTFRHSITTGKEPR